MVNRDLLIEASKRGLLQDNQIEPLLVFLTSAPQDDVALADPEEMHFARGFHDIFISLGLGILFAGYFIGVTFLTGDDATGWAIALAGGMVTSWLLAEWFSKKLRLSLPSILLTGTFVILSGLTAGAAIDAIFNIDSANMRLDDPQLLSHNALMYSAPFLFALLSGWVFYRRFGVPITPAFMAIAGSGFVLFLIAVVGGEVLTDYFSFWLFVIGLGCLALALRFDTKDPLRHTINSDKAFWLHLASAPLIVHSILSSFAGMEQSALASIVTIVLVAIIGLFALIIDRRALLASAIGYLGFAVGVLLEHVNLGEAGVIPLTLLLLGMFVLMLGSGWASLRSLLLRPMADHPLLSRLPPVSPKGIAK